MLGLRHFRFPSLCLVALLAYAGFVKANDRVNAIIEDFEDSDEAQKSWYTNTRLSQFSLVNGTHGHKSGAPTVDATTGTAEGQYSLADYDSFANTRWLFSSCFPPSGKGCTLNFSAVIELKDDEEFVVCAMKQCLNCQTIHYSHDCISLKRRTESWTELSLPITSIPTPFDISFGVGFLYPGSFLAIDDIKLIDCDREYVPEIICSHDEIFQCDYTHTCLKRDQLCDLHPDCECGEDETDCDDIPPEGRFDLKECDFYSGNCLWYDVRQSDHYKATGQMDEMDTKDFLWQVTSSQYVVQEQSSFETPTYIQGLGEVNDTYLKVDLPAQDPPITSFLRSVSFPPRTSGGAHCQIRFLYQIVNATLQLHLMARSDDDVTKSKLWSMSEDLLDIDNMVDWKGLTWYRAVVDIRHEPKHTHYVLQITATGESSFASGHASVQLLTLDRDCFTPDLVLTPCGNRGPQGPYQCPDYYPSTVPVQVIKSGREKGVQEWVVPETGLYRLQAFGSRGGLGFYARDLVKNSKGAKVAGKFHLTKGEKIFMVVGQAGMEACGLEFWTKLPEFCLVNDTFLVGGGGGGGGGGATLVYKKDKSDDSKILIVAGGGGGLPYELQATDTQSTGMSDTQEEIHQMTPEEAIDLLSDLFSGKVELEGSDGCKDSVKQMTYWGGKGGFGAGGGACAYGGNGGIAQVRSRPEETNHYRVGSQGRSFVHPSSLSASILPDFHPEDGKVEINSEWHCPCAYRCIWLDDRLEKATCVCPPGGVLQSDGISCSGSKEVTATSQQTSESNMLPVYIGITGACLLAICACLVCLYLRRSNLRKRGPHSMAKMSFLGCPCLTFNERFQVFGTHSLHQIARVPAVMHENPHYNLVTTSDTGLHEVNRKHLRLISELGQGAFGQVFYGQLSHVPTVGELPVAVKTLPAFSTEQTEIDFLLEAVIVSKFNHPNIVQFIGVCFEQHPHFLVLELLEGGDLKTFLRYGRPKWDQPSTLTMLDLLRLALDVARGCQHLEEKHFIHRDIAARNCLLTTKGPNRIAKIADFGMARDIYRSDYYKKAGKAMLPVKWMPPEAFLDGLFTAKTDVWSYGILLWEVFSLGHVPYPGCSNEEVMNLVTKGGHLDPPAGCPSAIADVMMSCWAGMAESRPTFALIISILERTIQDDETLSKGLPVCYVPPPIHPGGVRIRDASLSPRPLPKPTIGASCIDHRTQRLRAAHGDLDHEQGYLKPLLSDVESSSIIPRPMFLNPLVGSQEPKTPPNSSPGASGRQPWERDRWKASHGRVPKVFYRPGTCDVTIENQPDNNSRSHACASTHSDGKSEAVESHGKS